MPLFTILTQIIWYRCWDSPEGGFYFGIAGLCTPYYHTENELFEFINNTNFKIGDSLIITRVN